VLALKAYAEILETDSSGRVIIKGQKSQLEKYEPNNWRNHTGNQNSITFVPDSIALLMISQSRPRPSGVWALIKSNPKVVN